MTFVGWKFVLFVSKLKSRANDCVNFIILYYYS